MKKVILIITTILVAFNVNAGTHYFDTENEEGMTYNSDSFYAESTVSFHLSVATSYTSGSVAEIEVIPQSTSIDYSLEINNGGSDTSTFSLPSDTFDMNEIVNFGRATVYADWLS